MVDVSQPDLESDTHVHWLELEKDCKQSTLWRGVLHRLHQGVPYFQNVTRFHGAPSGARELTRVTEVQPPLS
jgi:hypothetical protein